MRLKKLPYHNVKWCNTWSLTTTVLVTYIQKYKLVLTHILPYFNRPDIYKIDALTIVKIFVVVYSINFDKKMWDHILSITKKKSPKLTHYWLCNRLTNIQKKQSNCQPSALILIYQIYYLHIGLSKEKNKIIKTY